MRTTLTMASLLGLVFVCGSLAAQPKEPVLPEGRLKPVIGMGQTLDKAKDDAIKQAVKVVSDLMAQHTPPLASFKVDDGYVQKHLLVDGGAPGQDDKIKIAEDQEMLIKKWIVTFRTDNNWWRGIVLRDQEVHRQLVSAQRQRWTMNALAGISAVLLAGFGYVRLDEYTKHRYKGVLRVAAVAVALSIITAWTWWFVGL